MQPIDSTRPAGGGTRKLRPWFLVVALIVAWFVGAYGATSGCTTVAILREGVVPDRTSLEQAIGGAPEPAQAIAVAHEAARLRAMAVRGETAFPLGVARLLLSTALVVACAMAMAGRPGARTFAMQAVLAYAVYAGIDYALSRPMRADWIPEVAAAAAEIARGAPAQAPFADVRFWTWFERMRFGVLELGTMTLAFLALASARSKAFFAAAAAESVRQRPDEDEES